MGTAYNGMAAYPKEGYPEQVKIGCAAHRGEGSFVLTIGAGKIGEQLRNGFAGFGP